ncbi:MAG TPA: hypothetical protein VFF52_04790 [Isosphaeraceae bacterium]|nr:hypothetical protein [Isosphaeraceae bacterium]
MLAHLRDLEIPVEIRPQSLRWALQTGLTFIGITIDEWPRARRMRATPPEPSRGTAAARPSGS